MYDKLKIWIDRGNTRGRYLDILNCLDKVHTLTIEQTGEARSYGSLEGLKVSVYERGISIVGSLPKYLYPNNLYTLDIKTTRDAILKLSDALHIDIGLSKITGLEFGTHFVMTYPVEQYLYLLGDAARLKRVQYADNTLYYCSKGARQYKNHIFYDKVAETAQKGGLLPPCYTESNLLRYELRYTSRLPQQLKANEVTGATLYDSVFYKSMVKRYLDVYSSISKKQNIKTNAMSEIKTVSDAYDALVAKLINQADPSEIESYLKTLRDNKVFKEPAYYTRLKRKLLAVSSKAEITERSELIRELDNEIKNTSIYQ